MARTFYNPYERDPVSTNSNIPGKDKLITKFDLDLSDLPATSEIRNFVIIGDIGAEFRLEIKDNTTGKYYNFVTNTFQATKTSLEESLGGRRYSGNITFPAVTGSDDQYDIYLYAKLGTKHINYTEARFGDGSIDINSSSGSNSLLIQKVIYQYAALTLTLQGYSIGSSVTGTMATDTISINRGKSKVKTAFSFACTAGATAAYRILKQPVANDVLAFIEPVIGSDPVDLPGENIYPTATEAFTGDDINGAITSGSVVRMDNTDLSEVIKVGDKITTATTTGTVDGALTDATVVTLDQDVADLMAVGDRVTGTIFSDTNLLTVTVIGTGGNAKRFTVSEATDFEDGESLTFSSKINRSTTTVTVVETSGVATDFTMSQAIQFRDNAPLTFFNRKNHSWPIDNYADIINDGMIVVADTNVTAESVVNKYQDTVTIFEDTTDEEIIVKDEQPAIDTLGKKPTVVKGLITVQEGQITFNQQQFLALAGNTLKIGGYGESEILRIYGWDVKFTDLAVALTAPTTTTTAAINCNATVGVASREGIINNVSRIGGIGVDSSVQNPLITGGGSATGSGNLAVDAVQTLESGITLTVENTSRVATITGNIEIVKAGTADQTLRFDVNKLLSNSA